MFLAEYHVGTQEFAIRVYIFLLAISSKPSKLFKSLHKSLRALRDPTFDLKSTLLEGRRDEQSKYQAQQIESKEQTDCEANKLEQKLSNGSISNSSNVICRNCGRAYPHTGACPAKGNPVIIVENRIISLLFVEENKNKNKRDHRDTETKSMHKEI